MKQPWTKLALYSPFNILRKNKDLLDMAVDELVLAHSLALFSLQQACTIFSAKSWACFKWKPSQMDVLLIL